MNNNDGLLMTREDGRIFPVYEGKPLAWSLTLAATWQDASEGYPRLRTVLRAMRDARPAQLARNRRELIRSSFDKVLGQNARRLLRVLEEECGHADL